MDLEQETKKHKKISDNPLSLDSRDIAAAVPEEKIQLEKNKDKNRLEINILEDGEHYQEVEIIYGDKKKRKRITKLLPHNFANFIQAATQKPAPSMRVGAMNLANLSQGSQQSSHMFLQEKFLRVLSKINQISQKTPEKIWDSEERINTTEKAILVAVINCNKPLTEHLDRVIVSMRTYEIPDQPAFKNFIAEVVDLTKNPQKLTQILFGKVSQNLSPEKKANLENCLSNIVAEVEDAKQNHQIKILQKVVNENSGLGQDLPSS